MNQVEGGSLFARQISEYIVNEAIKQEGHAKYNERMSKLKRLLDYLLDLVLLPLAFIKMIYLFLLNVFGVIFFVLMLFVTLISVLGAVLLTNGFAYTIKNYGACRLENNTNMFEDMVAIYFGHSFTSLLKGLENTSLFISLHDWIDSKMVGDPYFFVPSIWNCYFSIVHTIMNLLEAFVGIIIIPPTINECKNTFENFGKLFCEVKIK